MLTSGVHHVSLNVTNAAESTRFYVDVLGFSERSDRPDFPFAGAWLQVGDQQVHLLEVADFVPPKGQHFALQVGDIDAVRTELIERGVAVSEPSCDRRCVSAVLLHRPDRQPDRVESAALTSRPRVATLTDCRVSTPQRRVQATTGP